MPETNKPTAQDLDELRVLLETIAACLPCRSFHGARRLEEMSEDLIKRLGSIYDGTIQALLAERDELAAEVNRLKGVSELHTENSYLKVTTK